MGTRPNILPRSPWHSCQDVVDRCLSMHVAATGSGHLSRKAIILSTTIVRSSTMITYGEEGKDLSRKSPRIFRRLPCHLCLHAVARRSSMHVAVADNDHLSYETFIHMEHSF